MRRNWLILAGSVPLLLACVSGLHSTQPAQQQYLLSLQAPPANLSSETRPAPHSTLLVLRPTAAAGLDEPGIAVLRPGQRLDYYNDARWAQAAPAMLQALLIEALRREGRFSLVEPDTGAFNAGYLLSVDITSFNAQYDAAGGPPVIHVSLVCTLGRATDRSVLTTLSVNSSVSAAADKLHEVIAAFEQATNQALWRIADQLTIPSDTRSTPP